MSADFATLILIGWNSGASYAVFGTFSGKFNVYTINERDKH